MAQNRYRKRLTWIPTRSYKAGLKYKNNQLDLMINFRARWLWWNVDDEFLQALFQPEDKKWLIDFRISKGFRIAGSSRIGIFLEGFNLLDELYWDRKDLPAPKRWFQLGFELNFN